MRWYVHFDHATCQYLVRIFDTETRLAWVPGEGGGRYQEVPPYEIVPVAFAFPQHLLNLPTAQIAEALADAARYDTIERDYMSEHLATALRAYGDAVLAGVAD
jgi:hypothetical protein